MELIFYETKKLKIDDIKYLIGYSLIRGYYSKVSTLC